MLFYCRLVEIQNFLWGSIHWLAKWSGLRFWVWSNWSVSCSTPSSIPWRRRLGGRKWDQEEQTKQGRQQRENHQGQEKVRQRVSNPNHADWRGQGPRSLTRLESRNHKVRLFGVWRKYTLLNESRVWNVNVWVIVYISCSSKSGKRCQISPPTTLMTLEFLAYQISRITLIAISLPT